MGKYNEELMKAGVLVDLAGLKPSSNGFRVHYSGGKPRIIDGPFAETKELIGGYWIINVKSREEAIEWARRAPAPHPDQDCEIEVRQYFRDGRLRPQRSGGPCPGVGRETRREEVEFRIRAGTAPNPFPASGASSPAHEIRFL